MHFIVRGVPRALAEDAWWLDAPASAPKLASGKGDAQ